MAIETICRGCARKLRVGDEFAGRKARCPHCKTIYTVPAGGAGIDVSPEPTTDPRDGWLLRTKDGAVYGPVSKTELDGWVRDGRLDATSQVRREDDATWRQATDVYPSLLPLAASTPNPFASEPTFSAPEANPYTSSRVAGLASGGFRPHRGGLILTLALLGLFCCQFLSIAAWVMGHADMREINAGRMDPEGRGLTQAGMIIGIIGTVLMVLTCGFQVIVMVFALVNQG
ncbi:MAG: DUF4190 domain-containing protein [Planctomycetota bacterium]